MEDFDRIFLVVFLILFVGMWLSVITVLRKFSRMQRKLDVTLGTALRESAWGSASINGVSAQNSAKIEEHPDGYVVRLMWLLGGGRLWLPKSDLRVGKEEPGWLIFPRSRTLVSGTHRVVLYAHLSDFVS